MEWASTPVPTAGRSGIPSRRLICNQGDPGCDTDSDPNSCTFHIRLCFNNKDARLYPCVPSAITQFEVKSPNPQRLKDSADHANLATLEQQAGAGHFGVTVKEQAFVVFNGQPDSLLNDCTDPMNIVVPLRQLASGRKLAAHKSLRIRGTNSAGQVDTDSLRLDCRPGTSVPGTPTSTAIPSTPTNTPVNTATATPAGPTSPPTLTFTPSATNTQGAPTATPTITPTRTVSPTFPPAACGNGITEPPEECDDGGFCIGGSNAGTACTVEAQCVGNGICEGGTKVATSCASNADCPGAGGRCVHCKTFGGDGCAANCTLETGVLYKYVPGNPSNNPAPGTSYAFVHGKTLNLPLPLTGQQTLTVGAEVNNEIPFIVKASSVVLPAIRISTLACACVRAIPAKTCGGTLYESDGTPTTDCSDTYTAGPSVCTSAGKNPCTYVHGPGNSASGVIGCAGLDGINLSYTEDAGGTVDPPAPTPPAGSSPPVVVLSGSGGPGSAVALNSNAIGQTTGGSFAAANRCNGTPPAGFTDCSASDYGADCKFCTNDDPQSARGNVTTLPLVTGTAVGEIFNSGSPGSNIGPYSVNGHVFDCPALTSSTPSVTGADLAGAFTALNQQVTGDIVVVDELAAQ